MRYDAIGNITWKSDVGSYRYGPVNNRPHAVVNIDTSTARNRNASSFNPTGNYQYNGNGQNMQMTYGP